MYPDYKNWIPKGMVWSFAAGTAVCLAVTLIVGINWLKIIFLIITIGLALVTLWTVLMYRAFSYDGKRQMSRQIIEGVAGYIHLPEGGRGLDVGCGSGALTIAVAKRNPQGKMTGIDRWGAEYASFNKPLCEDNARAEGVFNRLSADWTFTDQIHALLGYDYFYADGGMFLIYKDNSEVWVKLKYSF